MDNSDVAQPELVTLRADVLALVAVTIDAECERTRNREDKKKTLCDRFVFLDVLLVSSCHL